MDRRLNCYNGTRLYEVGTRVWVVITDKTDDFFQKQPKDLIREATVLGIIIRGGGVCFEVVIPEEPGAWTLDAADVHDSEKFATQYCLGRAIELLDKRIKKLNGDVDYALSQIRVYTEKREKFYQQLKEA